MDSLENDLAAGFFESAEPPCVSLYQPTHRNVPDKTQDPIRFRNLVRSLGESLREAYPQVDADAMLERFSALANNFDFWAHTLDGLAVLATPQVFRVYRLQRPVPETVVVADSFHLKPLRRIVQSADRFQLLALSRDAIQLYEGNRDTIDPIEPADDVPTTLVDALGDEVTEPPLTVAPHGGPGGRGLFHGHGGRQDEADLDAERYFRAVDRAVLEHHSRPSNMPLLLVGLPENQALFRSVSRNPFLAEQGIDSDPGSVSIESLRERAWQIIEPWYLERLNGFITQFKAALGTGLATDDLDQAARAAAGGRIATLLIDADRQLLGRIDPESGRVERNEGPNPGVDDILDDLGELVVRKGGEWIIVPSERMPTRSGLAAIFRY